MRHIRDGKRGKTVRDQKKPGLVNCPDEIGTYFAEAERTLGPFFANLKRTPEEGLVTVSDMRYLLIRPDSISIELHDEMKRNFGEAGAWHIAYRLGKALGKRDARTFHERFVARDSLRKLALGPVHFAHTGWAFVDILEESRLVSSEDYFLVYRHPHSFEAEAFLKEGRSSDVPVCHLNAGYSCGWCEESFDLDLTAEEITCRAAGDAHCLFVMAHNKHIKRLKEEYIKTHQAG